MAKIFNILKLSVTAIFGFCAGVIVYIAIVLLSGFLFRNFNWNVVILIVAIFLFPFVCIPFAVFLAVIAMYWVKNKIDTNSPTERSSNTIIFAVIIVILSIVMIAFSNLSQKYIWKSVNKPHADGIEKIYDSHDGKLFREVPYSNGEENGIEKMYYLDTRYSEIPYKNGKKDGVQTVYCKQNSQVRWEVNWKNGEFIKESCRCFDENGLSIGFMDEYKCMEKYCK